MPQFWKPRKFSQYVPLHAFVLKECMSTKTIGIVHTVTHEKPTQMSGDPGGAADSPTLHDFERFHNRTPSTV